MSDVNCIIYVFNNSIRDGVIMRLFHKYRPLLGHLNLQGCSRLTPESLKRIGILLLCFYRLLNCYTNEIKISIVLDKEV